MTGTITTQVVGRSLLPRLMSLLTGFVRRPHTRLAAVGVEAMVRLVNDCGALFAAAQWDVVLLALAQAVGHTLPDVYSLVRKPQHPPKKKVRVRVLPRDL